METEHHDVDTRSAKEERIQDLVREIDLLTLECEGDSEFDFLAMTLIGKAIQSLHSRYNEENTVYAFQCMLGQYKKKVPPSDEKLLREKFVRDWLSRETYVTKENDPGF